MKFVISLVRIIIMNGAAMIQKTSMTIDTYLRNAGLKPAGTTGRKQYIPLKTERNPSFSEDLASALSSNPSGSLGKKAGLTIADYLNQAITGASRGFFSNSTIHAGFLPPDRLNRFNPVCQPSKEILSAAASAAQA